MFCEAFLIVSKFTFTIFNILSIKYYQMLLMKVKDQMSYERLNWLEDLDMKYFLKEKGCVCQSGGANISQNLW